MSETMSETFHITSVVDTGAAGAACEGTLPSGRVG